MMNMTGKNIQNKKMKLTSTLIKQLIREAIESNESKYNIYKFTHNNTGKVIYAYSKNFKTPESLFNNYIWHINNSKSKSDDVSDTIKSVIAQYPNWEEWKGETLFTDLPQLDAKLEINKLIKSDVNSINAKLAGVGNPGSIEKTYVKSDYILPPSVAGDKMYIRGDVLDDYPKVKVNKINSILNKTDNKVYYLVTNPSMVDTGRPLDSLIKISSTRKATPDEERELKLQQEKSDDKKIEKYKAQLDAAGNPTRSELGNFPIIEDPDLRKKYERLYKKLFNIKLSDNTRIIDYFYPGYVKKSKALPDKEKIEKFKAELDALGNPTRSELGYPEKIEDPDIQKTYFNLYQNLGYNTLSDGTRLIDYFYPEHVKRSKALPDDEKIEKFKAKLNAIGNPTKSELFNNHRNLYDNLSQQKLSDNTKLINYFYPKSDKTSISEVWKLKNILLNLYKKR